MQQAGCTTFMFLCKSINSSSALQAYDMYARHINDLSGMFTIQYSPYEAGDGKVFWAKNCDGIDIPVITIKYCIWANIDLPGSGTPAKIARLLNSDAAKARAKNEPFYAVVMTHAWSGFKQQANDCNDRAENGLFQQSGTKAGITPTKWCVDRLDPAIKVVSPEELVWRIRMAHNPQQTKAAIKQIK